MTRSGAGGSGGGGSELDPSALTGYATEAWCNETFVSIAFFDQIFQVYDDEDKLAVNGELPVDTSKLNIKAMFGFWTDFYLTALGNGGEIGASIYLSGLADVNVAGVANGQVLTWNASQNKWVATTPSSGTDMATVWAALAASTAEQINATHLATALNGYATQTWVGQQGFATQTWVETHGDGRYLKLTGGELTGMLKVTGAPIFGYVYSASNNRAAFIFDKPGSNYTGIGANAVSDQIYFGACDANGDWVSYKQKWLFNGDLSCDDLGCVDISCDDISCDDIGCGDINATGDVVATGLGHFGNVLSDGYVTALSDKREKNIIESFEVSLRYIADAPVVSYTWKDKRRGDRQHIGSIAQYWLREMPELVPEVNGRYTMDYGRIALLSAILTARHVVNLEQRIDRLEKMIHDGE